MIITWQSIYSSSNRKFLYSFSHIRSLIRFRTRTTAVHLSAAEHELSNLNTISIWIFPFKCISEKYQYVVVFFLFLLFNFFCMLRFCVESEVNTLCIISACSFYQECGGESFRDGGRAGVGLLLSWYITCVWYICFNQYLLFLAFVNTLNLIRFTHSTLSFNIKVYRFIYFKCFLWFSTVFVFVFALLVNSFQLLFLVIIEHLIPVSFVIGIYH